MPEDPIDRLVAQSLTDTLYQECKAYSSGSGGNLRFAGQGGLGVGYSPIYSSWDAWDRAIDRAYAGGTVNRVDYRAKVGDLSQSSLVVAAIRFLSNALPEPRLEVKENAGSGKGDSEVVQDHPLTKLWERPNDFYSGSTLKKGIAFSWILSGNAYIIKFYNNAGTAPYELWYEPHWTIRPVWPIDGSEFIDHYEVNRDGEWIPVPVENVIHLRDGIHPYNQRIGWTGIDSVLRELYGDMEAANYYGSLMGGSAVPPFMVSIDAGVAMKQEQVEEFTRSLIRKTTGERRGEPIVAKGAKAYKLGFNPRELDLRETRYMAEDRFCAVMGIPAVVLELGSGQAHSIYNNVKQAMERAYRSYIMPLLNHIEEELQVQLLEDFEGKNSKRYLRHDLSKVYALQENDDEKAARLGKLFTDGAIMRSEVRSGMGYGTSVPDDDEVDKVFQVATGVTFVKPGEDPQEKAAAMQEKATATTTDAEIKKTEEAAKIAIKHPNPVVAATLEAKKAALANGANGAKKKPLALVKALGNDLSEEDRQETIAYLKRVGYERAVLLMEAKSSENGASA